MMIEPPGQFVRRRILEIDDRVFIAIEHFFVEQNIARAMQQTAVINLGVWIDSLMIKTREGGRGSHAIKTVAVIKDAKFHFTKAFKKPVILATGL